MKAPIYFFLCLIVVNSHAQGIHFSDHREMPIQLNPAFTGIIHNDYLWRVNLVHRRQGNAILGTYEFETTYLSLDKKFGFCDAAAGMFAGIGLEVLHDQVGHTFSDKPQYFHRQEAKVNAALGLQIDKGTHLIAGVKLGLLSHGLSDQDLRFDNQFNGRDFDSSIPSMEGFEETRFTYFDIGTGVLLRGSNGSDGLGLKTYEIGVSILHLINNRERFLTNSQSQDLVKEYRFHAKLGINFMKGRSILPSFIFYTYDSPLTNSKQWQIRSSLEYPILGYFIISGGVRLSNFAERGNNPDALVFTLKWKPYTESTSKSNMDNLIVGIAFDVNVSPNSIRATNGFGGIEVFATYYFGSSSDEKICCPWSNTTNHVFY